MSTCNVAESAALLFGVGKNAPEAKPLEVVATIPKDNAANQDNSSTKSYEPESKENNLQCEIEDEN
eukprot:7574967-Ditylum_brightwellii.AAC.1